MRTRRRPVLLKGFQSNLALLVWTLSAAGIGLSIGLSDWLQALVGCVPLTSDQWAQLVLLAIACTWWVEVAKLLLWCTRGMVVTARRRLRGHTTEGNDHAARLLAHAVG